MGNWMQYACQIISCNGSFGLLWGDISTCVPYVCAELHYTTKRILHKLQTHTSGVIFTRENRAMRVFWECNTRAQDNRTTIDSVQRSKAWKVLFICAPHYLWHAHNEVAETSLNKGLMNFSSSRLGRAVDRIGCGDCQPSTWDSWGASWGCVSWQAGCWQLCDRSVSVPERYL